jgi:1-acyl-sn-glycerol-3-phosphate acyltransferase
MSQSLENLPPHSAVTPADAGAPAAAPASRLLPTPGGVYRSPPARPSWLARAFPSAAFYPKFAWIVWRAAQLAKRGRYTSHEWSLSSLGVLRALESVGVDCEFTGIEHLERLDGPCVIAGNHMSTFETCVLPCVTQPIHETTFVVKQSLVEVPVFKHVMRSRNPVAISQTNPREDLKTMLVEGSDRLQRGVTLIVFPEASRMRAFNPAQFNSIGVKLAGRNDVPIVPLALLTDAWALGRRIADLGRIDPARKARMAFGEPMRVSGRGAAENQAIIDYIRDRLAAWAVEDEATSGRAAADVL